MGQQRLRKDITKFKVAMEGQACKGLGVMLSPKGKQYKGSNTEKSQSLVKEEKENQCAGTEWAVEQKCYENTQIQKGGWG